jgi:hypothetical protein
MTARRRIGLASLVLLGSPSCNDRFAFDERTEVADAASALSDAGGPVSCRLGSTVGCLCAGSLCSCARQQWCSFTGDVCTVPGRQCAFVCDDGSRCEGRCQGNCKLECEHESSCAMTMGEDAVVEVERSVAAVTVGARSKVHCENDATCDVTCTGPCVVECQSGARCELRCPGDAGGRRADGGGRCPA